MTVGFPLRAVTLELSQVSPSEVDAESLVDFFAARGFTAIVCFALGYLRGEAYYPSRVAPPHPELEERDLVREVCDAAAGRGLAVIAYVNSLFGGPEAHVDHPDWTQRWADGRETVQGDAKAICPNSPYGDLIVAVAEELAAGYPIAGLYLDEPSLQSWCMCSFCRSRYRDETGGDLPAALEPGTAELAAFLDWRADVVAGFVAKVGEAARQANPAITYFAQHAFPLSSTAHPHLRRLFWGQTSGRTPPQFEGWYRPTFYGQDIGRVARHLDMVGIEPWRRFVGRPVWWQGACVSYARSAGRGKPVVPLMEYPHFPWGLGSLPSDELEVDCADVVANGGELWWPMYAPGAADRSGWDALADLFPRLDGARPAGARQVAPYVVLVSRRTAERFGANDVDDRYLDDLIGTIQLVRELHVPYKLVAAETLEADDLADSQVVFAPSPACLDEREAGTLKSWVDGGGLLVASGWAATHDETGRLRPSGLLDDVLGVRLGPGTLHAGLGYLLSTGADGIEPDRRFPVRDEQPVVDPVAADVLFGVTPSWDLFAPPADGRPEPSITRHRYGSGTGLYAGPQLGRLRLDFELFEAREILRAVLGPQHPSIEGELGPEVGIHAWQAAGNLHLILVNATSVGETGRVPGLSGQRIRLRGRGSDTVVSMRGEAVARRREGDDLIVEVGSLGTWACLIVSSH